MTFKDIYLFEREDENILSKVTPEAERLLDGITEGLDELFDKVFVDSKDFKDYDAPFFKFTFDYVKFEVQLKDEDMVYRPKTKQVIIKDPTVVSSLRKLDSIVEALKTNDEPMMVRSFKLKAKDLMVILIHRLSKLDSMLTHELVHKYDDEVNKIHSDKYINKVDQQLEKLKKEKEHKIGSTINIKDYENELDKIKSIGYYNEDVEVNAYFIQSLYNFLEHYEDHTEEVSKDFSTFKNWYVNEFLKTQYSYWNDTNRKKFIKRLYDFYTKFLLKLNKGKM